MMEQPLPQKPDVATEQSLTSRNMSPAQPSSSAEQLLVPPSTLEPKTSNKSSKEGTQEEEERELGPCKKGCKKACKGEETSDQRRCGNVNQQISVRSVRLALVRSWWDNPTDFQ